MSLWPPTPGGGRSTIGVGSALFIRSTEQDRKGSIVTAQRSRIFTIEFDHATPAGIGHIAVEDPNTVAVLHPGPVRFAPGGVEPRLDGIEGEFRKPRPGGHRDAICLPGANLPAQSGNLPIFAFGRARS